MEGCQTGSCWSLRLLSKLLVSSHSACCCYCVSWDLGCLRYPSPGCIITSGRYKFSIIFIFSINCIDSLKDNKAPGNDGITGEFYKCFKQAVAPFLAGLFEEALESRQRRTALHLKTETDKTNSKTIKRSIKH